jgi:hypothetical protein
MDINLIKRADGLLEAADNETMEALRQYAMGTYMPCKTQDSRSWGNHKRWFNFVNVTFDMQDVYDDKETWRGVLQIMGGRCRTVIDREGCTHIWPESISWKHLSDESKFRLMFKRSINGFLTRYRTDITESQFLAIMQYE